MFKHYLKIALRNILKYKTYSFINVFGLALGVACCVLVFLFVQNEMSYDQFHENGKNLYRVNLWTKTPGGSIKIKAGQPPPLAPTLKASFPEIIRASRLKTGSVVIHTGEAAIKEKVLYVDNDFFTMFTLPFRHGNPTTALVNPNAVVMSETLAEKYFGHELPLGKTLSLRFGEVARDFTITGVTQKVPENSSLQFDLVLSYVSSPNYAKFENAWTAWGAETFIQTVAGVQPAALQDGLAAFVKSHYGEMIHTWQVLGWLAKEDNVLKLRLQSLQEIHLDANMENTFLPTSNPAYSYILAGIGLIVLLIACINFTTLAIGRTASRVMEVGMRKTLGALRGQLVRQFWGEATLFSFLALLLGITLAEAFLPVFNALADKTLVIDYFHDWKVYGVFTTLVFFVGLAAGSYPAFYLSRFEPMTTLKKRFSLQGKNRLSQILIVVQFSLSIFLIVCVLIMSSQLDLLKAHNPGFTTEQIVVVPTNANGDEGETLLRLYREKLAGQNGIAGITGNSDGFNKETAWQSFGNADGSNWQVNVMRVDHDFLSIFNMALVGGRNFSHQIISDVNHAVIVNEALVHELGWQEPVGHKFTDFSTKNVEQPTVIGVVKDFNYASLHEPVKPMVILLDPAFAAIRYIFVKIAPGNFAGTVQLLRTAWQEIAPNKPFNYYFLDEDFDQQYRAEERWAQIVSYAMGFAMMIACIGLFGLSALTAAKRTKEIGIRKVLGASLFSVVSLLTQEFLLLITLANLLAWPVAYWAVHQWLQGYAYRLNLTVWPFALSGILAVTVALLTVSFQAIKAALANPVEALRYE